MEDDPNESFSPIGPRQILTAAPRSYGSQFDRVKRFLKRLESRHRSHVEYEDDILAFFLNCWHLKDWVKKDAHFPSDKRDAVLKLVHSNPTLMICRDLANGTKHLLSPTDVVAGHKLTAIDMSALGGEGDGVDFIIAFEGGATRSGYALAFECVRAWESIFAKAGVIFVTRPRR